MSKLTNESKNLKKVTKKDNNEKKYPVFRLKAHNKTNTATIKYVGFYNEGEKLGDETIDLDRQYKSEKSVGRNTIPLKTIGKFTLTVRLYKCNIVGSHIIASKRYPLMYLDVCYEKTLVTGSLFQIFLSLDIDKEQKKNIKDNKEYVDLKVNGIWRRHIDCDEELKENYEKFLVEMLETDGMDTLYKSNDEEIVKNERKFYDSLMNDQEMKFLSFLKSRDDLIRLCEDDKFNKFVFIAMKCRDIHRRKEHGLTESSEYVVPKEEDIVKLDDIGKKMMENGEIVFDEE
jgi:hypothetical protein